MKTYKMECIDCGLTFVAKNRNALRCPRCRKEAQKQQFRENRQRKNVYRETIKPAKSISDILRELDRYNKEHGTFLSYGQYVETIDKGVC